MGGANGAGVIATTLWRLPGSTFTRARSKRAAAAARPSPSPSQFTRKSLRFFGNTPAVAVRPDTSMLKACSTRVANSGDASRGRSFFSSASSSVKSLMADKILFQRRQGVAVARGRRVLRNSEGLADFRESELVPNLHDQHLALLDRQKIDRGCELLLRVIVEIKLRHGAVLHLERGVRFAASAARIA